MSTRQIFNKINEYNIEKEIDNVLYRLDTTNPAGFFDGYEEGSESEEGYSAIFIDNTQFLQDLNNVNDTAVQQRLMTTITNLEVAKLTSTPYEYNITLLNVSFPSGSGTTNIVPAFIEQLKQYGTLTFSSLIIATLIVDILYGVIDPRIKIQGGKK